jgi:hypothetical protein
MLSQFKSMMLCTAVAALAGVAIQSQAIGQECSSCNGGYAARGCGSGCGVGNGQVRDSIHERQDRNALVAARNDAWPKPFACVDRQIYENLWGKYIDSGYERQCVLSSMHFDESGELNAFGRTIVTGLVQNMPQARKTIFVHRDGDEQRSQARLDNVRDSIEYMFGHNTPAMVAFSRETPMRVSALRVERLQSLEFEATPVPIIPIASGTQSVSAGLSN